MQITKNSSQADTKSVRYLKGMAGGCLLSYIDDGGIGRGGAQLANFPGVICVKSEHRESLNIMPKIIYIRM